VAQAWNKTGFIRPLIERERERERELELLKMFNEAAADVTAEDREERESLLGGLATVIDEKKLRLVDDSLRMMLSL
jgi:hypothetical protein